MLSISDIKLAIFDIDGTLLDSMIIWDDLCERYLASLGIAAEPDLNSIIADMTIKECAAYVIDHYGLEQDVDHFCQGINDIMSAFYRQEVKLKEGVRELLQTLKDNDIPMILVTTGDRELAKSALLRENVFRYFCDILSCNDYKTSKRDVFIFEEAVRIAARTAGCAESEDAMIKQENIWVFEDSLLAIKTASKLLYTTVAVLDSYSKESWTELRQQADYTVNRLDELLRIAEVHQMR